MPPTACPQFQGGSLSPKPPKPTQRQWDRAGASIEGEQTLPSREARKPKPSPSLPATAGTAPRSLTPLPASSAPRSLSPVSRGSLSPKPTQRQRGSAGASIEGEQTLPSREARKPKPSPSLPASAGTVPRSPDPTTCLIRSLQPVPQPFHCSLSLSHFSFPRHPSRKIRNKCSLTERNTNR